MAVCTSGISSESSCLMFFGTSHSVCVQYKWHYGSYNLLYYLYHVQIICFIICCLCAIPHTLFVCSTNGSAMDGRLQKYCCVLDDTTCFS